MNCVSKREREEEKERVFPLSEMKDNDRITVKAKFRII